MKTLPNDSDKDHALASRLQAIRKAHAKGDLGDVGASERALWAIKQAGAIGPFAAYQAGRLSEATGADDLLSPVPPTHPRPTPGVVVPRRALRRLLASFDDLASLAETVSCFCEDNPKGSNVGGDDSGDGEAHRADRTARATIAKAAGWS